MAKNQYNYSKLSAERSEIRLVHVRPGDWDDHLSCYLKEATLGESFAFEALSYVWGDPKSLCSIDLKDCTIEITETLAVALRHLRKKDQERIMWIDQLCINQTDDVGSQNRFPSWPKYSVVVLK
jgi:hypothetical protein